MKILYEFEFEFIAFSAKFELDQDITLKIIQVSLFLHPKKMM